MTPAPITISPASSSPPSALPKSASAITPKCSQPQCLKPGHLTCLQQRGPNAHPREASVLEIDEGMIEAKARSVLGAEMSKELEKHRMEEIMPKDDEEAARRVGCCSWRKRLGR